MKRSAILLYVVIFSIFSNIWAAEDNLISYWNFNENAGNSFKDTSPVRNLPGKMFNASWGKGISGAALEFKKKNSSALTPLPGSFHDLKGFTIDFYFNSNDVAKGYLLSIEGTPTIFVRFKQAGILNVGISCDYWREIILPEKIEKNRWYRMVIAVGDGAMDCYLNEKHLGKTKLPKVRLTNKVIFRFGKKKDFPWAGFSGLIDEVKFYGRKLSSDEIRDIDPVQAEKNRLMAKMRQVEKNLLANELVSGKRSDISLKKLYQLFDKFPANREKIKKQVDIMCQKMRKPDYSTPAGFNIYTTSPTSDRQILPNTDMKKTGLPLNQKLSVIASPGEYEATSFVVNSKQQINKFHFSVDLPDIPVANVDCKYLVCWYQDGGAWTTKKDFNHSSILIPDMLCNDRDFPKRRFDLKTPLKTDDGQNILPIKDAKILQECTLEANFNQQLFVTIHVPENTKPGLYTGKVMLKDGKIILTSIPLEVRVLPIKLVSPRTKYDSNRDFVYSVYTWSHPSDKKVPVFCQYPRNDQQFRSEMRNMAAHGIVSPLFIWDHAMIDKRPDLVTRGLNIAREAGLCSKNLYFGMSGNTDARSQKEFAILRKRIIKAMKHFRSIGIKGDVYWYGRDEKSGLALSSQLPAMRVIQEAGGKMLVSGFHDCYDIAGKVLDLCVRYGIPSAKEAGKWHSQNKLVWNYGAPQAGEPDPAVYRRNFGLFLWSRNFDGCADYCYIESYNKPRNPYQRSYQFVYPTIDGVIDTIAWDGFREGVDDVRYASTLKLLAEKLHKSSSNKIKQTTESALKFLNSINTEDDDLERVRLQIISRILELQKM
jgi:Concanavalin A-like lectin/glucanases superfamily